MLASANKHKIQEIQSILNKFKILSLADIGFDGEIEENGSTTEENSKIKALAVLDYCNKNGIETGVIADDTGLFVNALGGEPGVHSARYAGDHNDEANRQKLLEKLKGKTDRTAYFETCITFASNAETRSFFGRTFGKITEKKIGSDSFGYDCLFLSDDLGKTFGEATEAEKSSVSHRGRALEALKAWLEEK